jgi:hypothetical protein
VRVVHGRVAAAGLRHERLVEEHARTDRIDAVSCPS